MDNNNSLLDQLQRVPFFEKFTRHELGQISTIATALQFNPGAVVFSELSQAKSLFVLTKGQIHLLFDQSKIIEISPGQVFGDWAVVNDNMRMATARVAVYSEVIEIDAEAIKTFAIDPKIGYKIVCQIANNLVARLVVRSQIASHILIQEGESQFVEFKSSIRWNWHRKKDDAAMEQALLKSIAGFLNAKGGVLFVGVRDDGSVCGLAEDHFPNTDKMLLHVSHLVTAYLGKEALSQLHPTLVVIDEKTILRIDCEASFTPIFLTSSQEELFFVRMGNQTQSYKMRSAIQYIKNRF